LGSGEVSATIMALESAAALGAVVFYVVVVDVFVGIIMLGRANVVVGDHKRVGGGRVDKFMAEEANGFVFGGWCGAEEGELRERMDVHEVVGLSLSSVVHIGEKELKKSE